MPGKSVRDRPTAASVPSTVAISVAAGATMKLLRAARPHSGALNRFSYHCSDQPGIGYARKELDEKDSGTITRIGRTRNSRTRAQRLRWVQNQSFSIGDLYGLSMSMFS